MDGRRARQAAAVLDRVPRLRKATPRLTGVVRRIDLDSPLTTGWSLLLGLGWPAALMIGLAVEPAPVDPQAAVPVAVELASLALFAGLVLTSVAAAGRHALAGVAGVGTGLLAVAFSVSCPVSGHHAFGLWWVVQVGVMTAMLGASLLALGSRSRTT